MNPIETYIFENDLSNSDFASLIGKTRDYVHKLRQGDIFPSYNAIEQIDKIIPGFLPEFFEWYREVKK